MLQKRLQNDLKKQRQFYSGKKKKHTLKSQIVVHKKSRKIICTAFSKGRRHDFKLFKESGTRIHPKTLSLTDTGYQELKKIHAKPMLPKKKIKKNPLTEEEK